MNPFKYGGVVSGQYFYDRQKECKLIKNDLRNGNNLVMYAPRRYGKTSLIKKVLEELETEDIKTIYIDFFNITNKKRFLEIYLLKILQKNKFSVENGIRIFRNFVKSITPSVTFDDKGNPQFQINFLNSPVDEKSFEEIVNLPEKLSEGKKWVVVFDEFQEINKLNGENFEKELRALIQFHNNVSYVFMGSRTHLLMNMFRDKSRAFYKIGKNIKIDTIDSTETINFLQNKFIENKIKISNDTAEYIITSSDNIPYYIQFIAAELWQNKIDNKSEITKASVDEVIKRIIELESDYYLELYGNLTNYQKIVLIALSKSGKEIFSKEYMREYGLSIGSSTQRAVKKLIELNIIDKKEGIYVYSDPFFKKFIQLRNRA